MPGDEGAMTASITQLRRDHRIGLNDGVPRRVVSVFDVAEQSRELRRTFGLYPSPYTAAYATAFLEDVVRLLDEFDDIIVVYKPKRDVGSSGYFFTTTLDQQVRTIAEHPRGVVLRSDVNPWVPVAVADLSISIPFTSGALIASHYRRRGLFHDPLGRAHEHRYHQIEQLITHSYRELTVAVRAALDGDAEAPAGIDRFIGSVPGDSSTAAFRQLIVNGSADHAPTSSIGHEAMTAR
jgi:hypothetical protein